MQTYQRTREQGTKEIMSGNATDRINAIKAVVDNKSYAKIDGVMMDLTTAHVIMTVYNALNDINKAKFTNINASKMATIAYKLVA